MKNETLLAGKCDKTSKIIMDISQYHYFFSPKYLLLLRGFFSSVTEFYWLKLSNLMDRSSKKPNLPSKCRSLVKYSPIWTILWKTCVFFNSGSNLRFFLSFSILPLVYVFSGISIHIVSSKIILWPSQLFSVKFNHFTLFFLFLSLIFFHFKLFFLHFLADLFMVILSLS